MKTDLSEIASALKNVLKSHHPHLQVRIDSSTNFEVAGTKSVMQGKQKVDGHYFANIVPKPKDVRFYFFPIYTHVAEFDALSPDLQKFLKGKSCFHIKRLSPEVETEISNMVSKGVSFYTRDNLI